MGESDLRIGELTLAGLAAEALQQHLALGQDKLTIAVLDMAIAAQAGIVAVAVTSQDARYTAAAASAEAAAVGWAVAWAEGSTSRSSTMAWASRRAWS